MEVAESHGEVRGLTTASAQSGRATGTLVHTLVLWASRKSIMQSRGDQALLVGAGMDGRSLVKNAMRAFHIPACHLPRVMHRRALCHVARVNRRTAAWQRSWRPCCRARGCTASWGPRWRTRKQQQQQQQHQGQGAAPPGRTAARRRQPVLQLPLLLQLLAACRATSMRSG